ncbi:MAG: hypothetical protein ACRDJ5_11645 [Actinomycetota bacterium]
MPLRELVTTPEYEKQWSQLPPAVQFEVKLLEEEIQSDPTIRGRRYQRADGSIVDYSVRGVYLAYRLLDEERGELVELKDVAR